MIGRRRHLGDTAGQLGGGQPIAELAQQHDAALDVALRHPAQNQLHH
jgi:hypothetical protein